MIRCLKLIPVLSIILLAGNALGQSFKEFSGRDAFLQELNDQLVGRAVGDAKKDNKETVERFTEMWTELNSFNESQKQRIYTTSDELLKKKLRMIPEVRDYISTIIHFFETSQPPASFNEWHVTVDAVIEERNARKIFSDYMDFSSNMFRETIIFSSPNVEWRSDSKNFRFELEDGKPKLVFPSLRLQCLAKGDDAYIYNTSGVFYPLDERWVGKDGTVTWKRAGLDENKVYGLLKDYEIRMKYSNYDADSVTFYNSDYFDQPLLGKLQDKVQANATPENASFPTFVSYSQRLKINNIDKGIDYEGGFSQKGSRFIASGTTDIPAILVFYLGDKRFFEVSSVSFSIREEKITSTEAAVKFFLHQDSIVHPGLDFKFFRKDRYVTLFRSDEGLQKTPYFDSYHRVDIYSELITWKIDQPEIKFTTIPNSSDNRALFESDFYFRESRFDALMGMSFTHPLTELKNCFANAGRDFMYDYEVAKCMGFSKTDAMVLLLDYTTKGYVEYSTKTEKAFPKDRLFHYVAAKSQKQDYDVIQVSSEPARIENASLNLTDEVYSMKINGIKQIVLSDSHNVVLYPENGTVTMKKNRDFDFSGVIRAGRMEFFGQNYEFLYDQFKIEMPNLDSVRLIVSTGKKSRTGREQLARVKTVIESVNGTLEIDDPNNKSGLDTLRQYPIFTSHENSFVYYDRGSIQNNAYHRENFYFELDPFVFDSLDRFNNDRVNFEGNFTSAGIFPDFREELTLQEDYSLGFKRQTPPGGFDVYDGRGTYKDEIRMSHEGLRGSGTLKYLTSTSKSEDFLFLPEEMVAIAQSFNIEEQMGKVQYPPVQGTDVRQLWSPYEDNLQVSSTELPISMYDQKSEFTGTMNLTPQDLTGGGLFAFEKAELESNQFGFMFSDFNADTADFRLKSDDNNDFGGIQFATNNVQANVDFTTRKGEFISNDGTSKMEFPVNQYIAYMDRFTWFMDEEAIELSGGKSTKETAGGMMQFEGSRFISVHPDQDSLEFYSPGARYNLKDYIISAKDVEFIQVADALVYPDSGLITVQRKAKMETLTNCKIVANAITRYHTVDSATVDIFARRDYVGTGLYTYESADGKKELIRFNTVSVDSTYQTYAAGNISEDRGFALSPNFEYKGKVLLAASNKELTFTGSTRILHECDTEIPRTWFNFSAEIDPEEIYIPIEAKIESADGEALVSSIILPSDTGSIYSAFLSPKRKEKDLPLGPASGYLVFDGPTSEYRISNINRLVQPSLPGNYISLHANNCLVYSEGKLGFGFTPGQLDVNTVGNMTNNLKENKLDLDIMILLDFFFDDGIMDDMGKALAENAVGDPVDFERETYQKGLRELIGTEEADRLISTVTLTGQFKKFPEDLEKRMFLNELKMKWNPETESYQSVGKIGVGNIGKRQVNVKVTGKVEVVVGRVPEVNIYIEADNNTWWYFKYSRNVLQVFSSDEDFNAKITDLKPDKRKMKVSRGEAPFSFMLSSKRKKDDFLRKF